MSEFKTTEHYFKAAEDEIRKLFDEHPDKAIGFLFTYGKEKNFKTTLVENGSSTEVIFDSKEVSVIALEYLRKHITEDADFAKLVLREYEKIRKNDRKLLKNIHSAHPEIKNIIRMAQDTLAESTDIMHLAQYNPSFLLNKIKDLNDKYAALFLNLEKNKLLIIRDQGMRKRIIAEAVKKLPS